MGREENRAIFEDTVAFYNSDSYLRDSVYKSSREEEFFSGDKDYIFKGGRVYEKKAEIIVSNKRTMEAASYYAYNNKRVCVLNFASATNPGGGVTKGSSAQEEAICRVSTLYPCLNERRIMKSFYYPHRDAHDSLHNDDAVYTPGVVVFKSDTSYPVLLDREKWFKVNVITSAAPNLKKNPGNYMNAGVGSGIVDISKEDLLSLLERRIHRILEIAAGKENEVLVLGAFGCGAFSKPPEVVAEAMKREVEKFRENFETIEFAVFCPPYDDTNYRVFKKILPSI